MLKPQILMKRFYEPINYLKHFETAARINDWSERGNAVNLKIGL